MNVNIFHNLASYMLYCRKMSRNVWIFAFHKISAFPNEAQKHRLGYHLHRFGLKKKKACESCLLECVRSQDLNSFHSCNSGVLVVLKVLGIVNTEYYINLVERVRELLDE